MDDKIRGGRLVRWSYFLRERTGLTITVQNADQQFRTETRIKNPIDFYAAGGRGLYPGKDRSGVYPFIEPERGRAYGTGSMPRPRKFLPE